MKYLTMTSLIIPILSTFRNRKSALDIRRYFENFSKWRKDLISMSAILLPEKRNATYVSADTVPHKLAIQDDEIPRIH